MKASQKAMLYFHKLFPWKKHFLCQENLEKCRERNKLIVAGYKPLSLLKPKEATNQMCL